MDNEIIEYINKYIHLFSELNIDVTFLFVTETAYRKNIIDATKPVRSFLKRNNIHDYELQEQNNPKLNINNTVEIPTLFIDEKQSKETKTSMYRPNTKQGDPRLWFKNSKEFVFPSSIIALMVKDNKLININIAKKEVVDSLTQKSYVYNKLKELFNEENDTVTELLGKIKKIYEKGFVKNIGNGDPSVGETLEYYLDIPRNNSITPDYKGIELKAKRKNAKTRNSLFSQVPDWKCENGLSRKEIFDKYSYYSEDKNRMDLNVTLNTKKSNPQGLSLKVDFDNNLLLILGKDDEFLTQYDLDKLISRLEEKHHETFWLDVETKTINGEEFFKYYRIEHTKKPKSSIFPFLINDGIITLDFVIHQKENGSLRDHGFLFKINKKDRHLLFDEMKVYDFRNS